MPDIGKRFLLRKILLHNFHFIFTLAAQDGNVDSLQLLVNGGANVEAKNVRGQTALHLAALAQSPETVEVLLKAGKNEFLITRKAFIIEQ